MSEQTEGTGKDTSEVDGVVRLGLGKKIAFALVPLVLLYVTSETVLSAVDFAPFTPSPKNELIGSRTMQSPWGENRTITEQVFIGAHTRFEMPFYFRAFVPPPRAKPDGLKRIVFLGDSFIFGSGVQDHETLPFYLSAYLRYYRPELALEMINLGVNGGGARTYFDLRQVSDEYSPDLVVVGFTTANDFLLGNVRPGELLATAGVSADPSSLADVEVEGEGLEKGVTGIAGAMLSARDFLVPKSRTFSALFRPFRKFELGKRWDAYMKRTYDKNHEAVFEYLTLLGKHYEERGVPVVLLVYPFMFSTRHIGINDIESYRYGFYHEAVRRAADSAGLHVIDLVDYFRADGIRSFDGYQIDGDGHPNGAFNGMIASHLADDLLSWSLP